MSEEFEIIVEEGTPPSTIGVSAESIKSSFEGFSQQALQAWHDICHTLKHSTTTDLVLLALGVLLIRLLASNLASKSCTSKTKAD